jgi:hypothetical protein
MKKIFILSLVSFLYFNVKTSDVGHGQMFIDGRYPVKLFSKEELAKMAGPAIDTDASSEKFSTANENSFNPGEKVIIERSGHPKYRWAVIVRKRTYSSHPYSYLIQVDIAGNVRALSPRKIGKVKAKSELPSYEEAVAPAEPTPSYEEEKKSKGAPGGAPFAE